MRQMIAKYALTARRSGARLVFCAGADSIPWDLAAFLVNQRLVEKGERMVRIDCFNEGVVKMSGGTLKTALLKIDGVRTSINKKLEFDPLRAISENEEELTKSPCSTKILLDTCVKKDSLIKQWVGLSIMGFGNSRVVLRSNALNQYHEKFTYREVWTYQHFTKSINTLFKLILLATCVILRPLRWLLLKMGALPSPGGGPSEKEMAKNYLIVDAIGKGSGGSQVSIRITFNEDIGYIDTARMLVESGLCFVFQSNECVSEGGAYTSSRAMGNVLYRRLEQSGTEFEFDPHRSEV